ncbi:hypothetical protein [Streptomyces sp. NPDC059816]|uniref:hypothetical protein n=1 Tax=Streptomyces sp. NPDC059816 TaxID=3346960 RepID=UPI003665B619
MKRLASAAVVTALGAAALVAPAGAAHAGARSLPTTDLSITGTAPDRAVPGKKVTYRLTVTNKGPVTAAPYLSVGLPSGSQEATYNRSPIKNATVRMDPIRPGESKQAVVQTKIGSDLGATLLNADFEVSQGPYDSPVYRDTFYANNILKTKTVNVTAAPTPGDHGSVQLTGRVTGGSEPGQPVRQRLVIHNTGAKPTGEIGLVGMVSPSSGEIVKVTGIEGGRGVITKVGLNYTLPPLDGRKHRVVTIVTTRGEQAGDLGGSYFAGADSAGYPELELRG